MSPTESRSLLRQQMEREGTSSEAVLDEEQTQHERDEQAPERREVARSMQEGANDVLERAPYLATPFASSIGSGDYGSLSSRVTEPSMRYAAKLYHEQQLKGREKPDNEQEPLLLKVVEHKDGKRVQVVIGQSTIFQIIFNSVNVLIGVGLLSLPLGLNYSGWIVGMSFLAFAAVTTRYTAGILAKCLDLDTSMIGFGDIAFKALGTRGSLAVSFIFTLELLAACVALIVLFADSLDALIPGWGVIAWKIFSGIVLVPLSFVPLRYLGFSSVLGIFACLSSGFLWSFQMKTYGANFRLVVTLIFVDGIIKPHFPGSLREPAPMAGLFPQRWSTLPLSFGLLMCEFFKYHKQLQSLTVCSSMGWSYVFSERFFPLRYFS